MKSKKSTTILKSGALLLLLLLIGGWFSRPAAAQGPIRVGCGTNSATNTTLLIAAIGEANARVGLDVIELGPNCTYQLSNHNFSDAFNGLPVIIEPLRIEGQGARLLGVAGRGPRHFHAKAPLTLVNLFLEDGLSSTNGGAILAEAPLNLIDVDFNDNIAARNGGAVYAKADLTVSGGEMDDNIANFFGGAIYAEGSSLRISNAELEKNKAGNGGGGIFTAAPATITNTDISRNKANINPANGFEGCGGGIQARAVFTLKHSWVNENEALRGGGVCASSPITASDNIFDGNTALLFGGGLFSQHTTTLQRNTFTQNRADIFGSAFFLEHRGPDRSELINNVWLEQQGPAEVMCLFCVNQTLGEVVVINNTIANAEPRSIDAITVRAGEASLVNNIIVNHLAGVRQQAGQVQTSRNLYFGNRQDEVGTISSANNHLTADPRFVDLARGDTRLQAGSPALGQALTDLSPAVDRRGIHRPQGNGPDIGANEFDEGFIPAGHVITLPACPQGEGNVEELIGAFELANAVAGAHRIELSANCTYTLTGATAGDIGGDWSPTGLPVVTDYLVVAGNGATLRRSPTAGEFLLIAATEATMRLHDLTLENGRSAIGGGILAETVDLGLTNVTLRDNTGLGESTGGLLVLNSRAIIRRSTFENNSALAGGAIAAFDSVITLDGNTFRGNRAQAGAGLIFQGDTSGNLIANNLWADHATTAADGSAVIILQAAYRDQLSRVDLSHNTIAGPTLTEGSGISVEGVQVTLRNNIISNYETPVLITLANGTQVTAEHNLTFARETTDSDVVDGQNNLTGDPLFVDPVNGNYRLQADSPAIDTGMDAAITIDLAGAARPVGGGFDMGAYEFGGIAPNPGGDFTIFLPLVLK